jgi:hypothetical protein
VVARDPVSVVAATRNATGDMFGYLCDRHGCNWIISLPNECDLGGTYPILASAGTATYPMVLECLGKSSDPSKYRYQVSEAGAMNDLVDRAKRSQVGIVVSGESGSFIVIRFSLNGLQPAVTSLLEMMKNHPLVTPSQDQKPARQVL